MGKRQKPLDIFCRHATSTTGGYTVKNDVLINTLLGRWDNCLSFTHQSGLSSTQY